MTTALTVAQVAAALHIGKNTAYDLIRTGQIPSLRIGRAIRVPEPALQEWITSNTQKGNP